MITIRYFAQLREVLGIDREQLELPPGVTDIQGVRAYLINRGGTWEKELKDPNRSLVAVKQTMATPTTPVNEGDEVAFFPPVTGG